MVPDQSLPETLPSEPLLLVADWLAEAIRRKDQPNPNAMVLATCNSQGRPAARVVLAKTVDTELGTVRFVSNYESRKGRELEDNPRAALVMHWDHLHRQVRLEGYVRRASPADSDAYFASRTRASQLGAHASAQSRPVSSREALQAQLDAVIKNYPPGTEVPRPPYWGGYVLWADSVELWLEGTARLHDRAQWRRTLAVTDSAIRAVTPWTGTRLQP
jgi:pyridoxamine 5'-phosphate oxidase